MKIILVGILLFSCKVQHHFATLELGGKLGRVNLHKVFWDC